MRMEKSHVCCDSHYLLYMAGHRAVKGSTGCKVQNNAAARKMGGGEQERLGRLF